MSDTAHRPLSTRNPADPAGLLMSLIIHLLTPMFLGVSDGDITLARVAAVATVSDYNARNHVDLLAIAQIIAFGLAALGSLSLSMAGDIPLALQLRLRGNGNACNRSAEQNRRALARSQADPLAPLSGEAWRDRGMPYPDDALQGEPPAFMSSAAEQLLAAESRARLHVPEPEPAPEPAPAVTSEPISPEADPATWVAALTEAADSLIDNLPNLPLAQRRPASAHAAAFRCAADALARETSRPRRETGLLDRLIRQNPTPNPPPASASAHPPWTAR
jgi:hypothetical protein